MTTKRITVNNRVATYRKVDGAIICGNSDYVIAFTFDSEWDGVSKKTARFIWGGQYFDVEFEGTQCTAPVIDNATEVEVGVYAGDLRTTTSAVIDCLPSILSGGQQPNPGTGQHYSNEAKAAAARAEAAVAEVQSIARDATVLNARITRNSKRITNLEQRLDPELFVTDASVAYVKEVPQGALPYAMVTRIGGMSYAIDGQLVHAKPTALKIVGANNFNPQWLLDASPAVTKTADGFYNGQAAWFYEKYGLDGRSLPFAGGFKENTAYTIQFDGYNKNLNLATFGFQYFYTDGTSDYSPFISSTTAARYTKVTDGNKTLQKITMTYSDNDTVGLGNICIIEGAVSAYTPYTEKRLAIPAAVQALDGYGYGVDASYHNYIDWETKKYHKVLNKIVFDGSADETWRIETGGFFATYIDDLSTAEGGSGRAYGICDNYESTTSITLPDKTFFCYNTNFGYASIAFNDSGVSQDVASWRAHLSANPITLVYTIVTPEVTDISDILPDDNLIAVEGGGTITAENEHSLAVPTEITYQMEVSS